MQNLGQTTLRDEDNKSASPKKIIVGNISNQNNSLDIDKKRGHYQKRATLLINHEEPPASNNLPIRKSIKLSKA